MEIKSTKGGKRLGAGRKPLKNPKKQVSLYIEANKFYKFGGEEPMKDKIYQFVDSYGEEKIRIQDLTSTSNEAKPYEQPATNFSVDTFPDIKPKSLSEFDTFKEKIYNCETTSEIEELMKKVKGALMFPKEKQRLEEIAKEHSKDFYTD